MRAQCIGVVDEAGYRQLITLIQEDLLHGELDELDQ